MGKSKHPIGKYVRHAITAGKYAYRGLQAYNWARKVGKEAGNVYRTGKSLYNYGFGSRKRTGGARASAKAKRYKLKKKNDAVQAEAHNAMGIYKKTIFCNKPKKGYKHLGDWQYINQCSGSVLSPMGYQAVKELCGVGTALQMVDGGLVSGTQPYFQLPDKLFDLDPYQKASGSYIIPANTVNMTESIVIKNIDMDLQITNGDTQPTRVEVIVYQFKKNWKENLSDVLTGIWGQSLYYKRMGQVAGSQATQTGGVTTPGYPTVYTYGLSPFSERFLKSYLKCKFRKAMHIEPGKTEKMLFKIKYNRKFRRDVTTNLTSSGGEGNWWVKGDLLFCMISRPGPMAVVNKDTADLEGVSIASTALYWTSTQHYDLASYGPLTTELDRANATFVTSLKGTQYSAQINDIDEIVQEGHIGGTIPGVVPT